MSDLKGGSKGGKGMKSGDLNRDVVANKSGTMMMSSIVMNPKDLELFKRYEKMWNEIKPEDREIIIVKRLMRDGENPVESEGMIKSLSRTEFGKLPSPVRYVMYDEFDKLGVRGK